MIRQKLKSTNSILIFIIILLLYIIIFYIFRIRMFSLQVHVRNLTYVKANDPGSQSSIQLITAIIGQLQFDIGLSGNPSQGGKKQIFQIQKNELEEILRTFAFGMFMKTHNDKYWCILSLEKVKIGEQYACKNIKFMNDKNQPCFSFEFYIKLLQFHPRVPKNNRQVYQVAVSHPVNAVGQDSGRDRLSGKPGKQSNIHSKNGRRVQDKNNFLQPQQYNGQKQRPEITQQSYKIKSLTQWPQENDGIYIPPVIQFVNQYQDNTPFYESTPILSPNTFNNYNPPTVQLSKHKQSIQQQTVPKLNPILTYSNYEKQKQKMQNHNKSAMPNKKIQENQKNRLNQEKRQKLRQQAKQQAEKYIKEKSNETKVLMLDKRTGEYILKPLSELGEKQILEYVQKMKKGQKFDEIEEERKRKEKQKQQRRKKLQQEKKKVSKESMNILKNQNIGIPKKIDHKQKISEKIKQSSESQSMYSQDSEEAEQDNRPSQNEKHQPIRKISTSNQESQMQNNEVSQNYEEDFQSISNIGSQLKSRISQQSSVSVSHQKERKKNNESDLSESIDEYGYSQDFDSFSQSMRSKNKKGNNTISDISVSLNSVSYRRV